MKSKTDGMPPEAVPADPVPRPHLRDSPPVPRPGEATVITGGRIRCAQLATAKMAISLEKKGLRHSQGSMRMRWARHFGMPGRPSYDAVIARIEEELKKLHAALGIGIV